VPLEDAKNLIKANADRAARERELSDSQRGATAQRLADLKKLDVAGAKAETQQKELWAFVSNEILSTRIALNEFIADINKMTQAWMSGQIEIQQAPSSADQIQTDSKDLELAFNTLTKNLKDIWARFWKEIDVQQMAPNASDQVQAEFKDLPPFFDGLTKTLGNIWKSFWNSLSMEAKAAALDANKSMAQIKADAQQANAVLNDVVVTASRGAAGVTVGRGPGTGDTGGYGPASLGGAGYGPGSRPTQSILPGTSDYQAPPPKRVDFAGVEHGVAYSKSAAESAADAAAASQSAAEASAKAVNAWVDPPFQAYAEGGMVHGPGTPTSDSVTARLSAGEFVMRAAAVQRWGPSFMAALNGMAGRMPTRGIPSFAGGGMVTAGAGGTPVHLHLGGHSFALVTEAHRQRMRSAGTKPSWYGGH
jgi:hypothetical protein